MKNTLENYLSPWFYGDIPPVRTGIYQLRLARSHQIIDGWYENGSWQICLNDSWGEMTDASNQIQWRGLNSKPGQRNLDKICAGMPLFVVTALIGKGGKPSWCQPEEEGYSTYTWADGDRWIKFVTFDSDDIVTETSCASIGD